MAEITLDQVTKRYPDGFEAVKDMNLASTTSGHVGVDHLVA